MILNRIELIKENRLYTVTTEENLILGVTKDANKIVVIIKEHHCDGQVVIDNVSFDKNDDLYVITATIFEDGKDYIYDFIVNTVLIY